MKRHSGSALMGAVTGASALSFALLICIAFLGVLASCRTSNATEGNARPLQETREGKLFWALVDTYSHSQVRKLKSMTEPENGYDFKPLVMPVRKRLLRLQQTFGDMPEYWQAVYLLTVEDGEGKVGYLRRVLEVAPDSPEAMYFAKVYPYPRLPERQLTREEDNIRALKNIVPLAQDESFFHYELAYNYEQLGEMDSAIAEMQLGNAAPVNRKLWLFPMSFVMDHVDTFLQADLDEDDRVRIGAMLSAHEWLNFIKRKDMIKEMIVALSLGGDTDMLNTVHQYAVRMGTAENATATEAWVATVFVMLLAEGYVDLSGDSPERDAVQELFDLSKRTRDRITGGGYLARERRLLETLSIPFASDEDGGIYRVSQRYDNVYRLYASFQDILREDIALRDRIRRDFLDIAWSFNYTDPAALAED